MTSLMNAPHAARPSVAVGVDMRLVVSHPTVRRVFDLTGIDTLISLYPDLPAALSGIRTQ
jgi:anti-anti-sigma regulatory factor